MDVREIKDDGRRTTDDGPRKNAVRPLSVVRRPSSVVRGLWTVVRRPLSVVCRLSSVVCRPSSVVLTGPEKARYVSRMFAAISPRYDLMNWLMTFGQDQTWRRLAVAEAKPPAGGVLLDVGTGTGDFLPLLADAAPGVRAVGADFTFAMMATGREKLTADHRPPTTDCWPTLLVSGRQSSVVGQCSFVAGDAQQLPFSDDTFDGLVNGFLLRNVTDLWQTLAEMRRVVKPGRRVVCLEITNPTRPVFRDVFRLYFHRLVPILGGMISGRPEAYAYLPQSVARFVAPDELVQLMENVGLGQVRYRLLALGTVAIHVGTK